MCGHTLTFTGHTLELTGHTPQFTGHRANISGHWAKITGHRSRIIGTSNISRHMPVPRTQRSNRPKWQSPRHSLCFASLFAPDTSRTPASSTILGDRDNSNLANHKEPPTARTAPTTAQQTQYVKQARKTNSPKTFFSTPKKGEKLKGPGGSADRCWLTELIAE